MPINPLQQMAAAAGAPPDEAKFFWTGGPVEVADGVFFQSLFSGTTAFVTADGLVLVDAGTEQAAPTLAARLRERTKLPVHTAIYTHGHVDHAFGLRAFLTDGQDAPRVVAHRATRDRFARYERTRAHNRYVNARQFGGTAEMATPGGVFDLFRSPAIPPDTVFETELRLSVGGLAFELRHCRGETDDHAWVWCPDKSVLCPGDLFIYAVPNAGNPQKVQRYPWEWAAGLREMAGLGARSMCPGHGGPVVDDAAKIRTMLSTTADYLDAIVARTIEAIEDGSPPHVDIVRRVEPPATDAPWLQPVYDEAEFIVRNVIRYFGGWWSGRPSELKPAPRADVALEIASLAGGPLSLAARARAIAADGDLRLASHLADYALEAAPLDPEVREIVATIYEERAAGETSLMAINLFHSAAAYARAGKPFA